MADLMTLTCPSCGGQLQVTNETDRFVCAHCGNSHVVDPGVRMASLAAEVEKLRVGSIVQQLEKELRSLQQKRNQLDAEVKAYQQSVLSEVSLYRIAGLFAFFVALSIVSSAIRELTIQRYGIAALAVAGTGLMVALGTRAMRQKPIFYTDSLQDVINGIAGFDSQIAQKQHELSVLQQQAVKLSVQTDNSISADTQHATRNTQPASHPTPS